MQSIKGLALQNIISIEEAYIPFDDKFICVTGHNQDSKISTTQNNASGKSTIFNAIANILYESDPMSAKKDRRAMLKTSDAKIQLDLQNADGNDLTVLQTPSKYFCSNKEDGDLKPQTIGAAQNLIKTHFPVTEDEFYAYCYISGNKPFEFQHATESNRFNFLAKLFRLDIYDQVRAHVKKLRDESVKSVTIYEAIAENVAFLQKKMEENAWNTINDQKEVDLSEQMKELEQKSLKLYDQKASMEASAKFHNSRSRHVKLRDEAKRELAKYGYSLTIGSLRKLEKLAAQIEAYADYRDAMREYNKELRELKSELAKMDSDGVQDPNELRKEFAELSSKLEKLEEELESAEEHNEWFRKTKARITELTKSVRRFKPIDEKETRKKLNNLEQIIDVAEELDGESSCPTCGQHVDQEKLQEKADKAEKTIEVLNKKLDTLELYQELETLRESIEGKKLKSVKSLRAEAKRIEKRLDEINAIGEASVRFTELNSELKSLRKNKPKQVAKPKTKLTLEVAEELLSYMKSGRNAVKNLKELPSEDFDNAAFEKLKKQIEVMDRKYRKLRKQHVEFSVRKTTHYSLQDQLDNADKEMKKLKRQVSRKKLYDTMYKVYGKELKGVAINDRLSALETVMNENAHLIFSEGMKFFFRAEDSKIHAEVLRENGLRSDISKLSGSESNCFRMLFAYSLLPILPSDRRTNFMILDEPDAACDPEVREHIIKNFVPHLREAVPNVFWITPKDVSDFDGCEHWKVIKKGGLSAIKKVSS